MQYGAADEPLKSYQVSVGVDPAVEARPAPANRARTALPLLLTVAVVALTVGFYSAGGSTTVVSSAGLDARPAQAVPSASSPSNKPAAAPAAPAASGSNTQTGPAKQQATSNQAPAPATKLAPAPAPAAKSAPAPAAPATKSGSDPAPATNSAPAPAPATNSAPAPAPATNSAPAPAPATNPVSVSAPIGAGTEATFGGDSNTAVNFLFLLVDDMGWNDMGYQSTDMTKSTPHLDALASEGVKLTRYYTQQSCTPARVALMTGKYPANTGMGYDSRGSFTAISPYGLPLEFDIMPQHFKKMNYTTNIIGKWNLGHHTEEYLPHRRGFDVALTFQSDTMHYYNYSVSPELNGFFPIDMLYGVAGQPYELGKGVTGYSTTVFTDRAIAFLDQQSNEDNPFFLYLAYQAVHEPHEHPPTNLFTEADDGWRLDPVGDFHYRYNFGETLIALDKSVVRVVNSLKSNALLDSTVLIVASDNGGCASDGSNNWPLRGGKFDMYEGGIRVPSFIYSPLMPESVRGSSHTGMFHVTDWLPTMLRMADPTYDLSAIDTDGVNQLPSLLKADQSNGQSQRKEMLIGLNAWDINDAWEPVKLEFDEIQAALRVGDYKLYIGAPHRERFDPETHSARNCSCGVATDKHLYLFDVANDELEEKNLKDVLPHVVASMKGKLVKYYNDSMRSVWKAPETMQAVKVWQDESYVIPWHRPDAIPLHKVKAESSSGALNKQERDMTVEEGDEGELVRT